MNPLSRDTLKNKIVRAVEALPAMPQILLKAQEIMADTNANFEGFERTLEADQALVATVLKLANSAYYGQSGKVSSIRRAAVILGFRVLGEVIVTASASNLIDMPLKGYRLMPGDLWRHSLAVAFGSRIIANRVKQDLANDAYIAGLLHDAGKLILDPYISEKKGVLEKYMEDEGKSLPRAEKLTIGFNHAEIAAMLCKGWNFPRSIYEAIRYHHAPFKANTANTDSLANILYTADEIAKYCVTDTEPIILDTENSATTNLGIQLDEIESIINETVASVKQITDEIEGTENTKGLRFG